MFMTHPFVVRRRFAVLRPVVYSEREGTQQDAKTVPLWLQKAIWELALARVIRKEIALTINEGDAIAFA